MSRWVYAWVFGSFSYGCCVFVLIVFFLINSWHLTVYIWVYMGSPRKGILKLLSLDFLLLGVISPVCLYLVTYISLDFPLLEHV